MASPLELSVDQARAEAPATAARLLALALAIEPGVAAGPVSVRRHWAAAAGTYTYHTHVAVPCQDQSLLAELGDCFFYAASLPSQPWYRQFLRGQARDVAPGPGVRRACINLPCFDFGLGRTHSYRQYLSQVEPDDATVVLVLRSIAAPEPFPAGTVPAYTLSPTGDVLRWREGMLHWHHICTVPGVGILPPRLERWLMNALRCLHLDHAERRTYREEAATFAAWAADPVAVRATWRQLAAQSLA